MFIYLSAPPVTVNVFPDPVCPYAKTVELYPSRTLVTAPFPILANTSSCQVGLKKCTQSRYQLLSGKMGRVFFISGENCPSATVAAKGCLESQQLPPPAAFEAHSYHRFLFFLGGVVILAFYFTSHRVKQCKNRVYINLRCGCYYTKEIYKCTTAACSKHPPPTYRRNFVPHCDDCKLSSCTRSPESPSLPGPRRT